MNKIGWLINDRLTCIPGTKTFWHYLLENIPNLIDKTSGFTPFELLANETEQNIRYVKKYHPKLKPDYIIRNASYFRPIGQHHNIKVISLLQDIYLEDTTQHQVLNTSEIVVVNSQHTRNLYRNIIKTRVELIPLGVDENLFKSGPDHSKELAIAPNSILFVGAATTIKGFSLLMDIVNNTAYNFVFVMKDDYKTDHPRIRVFNQVDEVTIVKIYNSCKMLLCTSEQETQNLATTQAWAWHPF
jgi:hypothetical protein